MSVEDALRERVVALEKELQDRRIGKVKGYIGQPPDQIVMDLEPLLRENEDLRRKLTATVAQLAETEQVLVMQQAVVEEKFPGGFDALRDPSTFALKTMIGNILASILKSKDEAQNFVAFCLLCEDKGRESGIAAIVQYVDGKTPGERIWELETEVQSLRGRIAELEDDQ